VRLAIRQINSAQRRTNCSWSPALPQTILRAILHRVAKPVLNSALLPTVYLASPMTEKITVLIPVKNERRNLRLCAESVRSFADEILVADSGSTDGTQELARRLGCRLIERDLIDFSNFKNWAIPQAAHSWVLIVDADERITPRLAAEIRKTLEAPPADVDSYWINRDTFFLGHQLRWGDCRNERVLRLFRRDRCRYTNRRVHESLTILPPAEMSNESSIPRPGAATPGREPSSRKREGHLRAPMVHYTSWTYAHYLTKMNHYSGLSARDMHDRGRRAGFWGMLLRPPIRFFQMYFLRCGFLDGLPGLQMAILIAFIGFLKQARLWELEHAIPQPDPEAQTNSSTPLAA
jgi:glycosyltransferase involved in cell wall biosynthesis